MSFIPMNDADEYNNGEYMSLVKDTDGNIHFKYTPIHLSPKQRKEFYTDLGLRIIDGIKEHGFDVELIKERFPPPLQIDTIAITSYDEALILISKEGWNDLKNECISYRMKDPSENKKWLDVKEYYIKDVLIHEFAHILMYERNFEPLSKEIKINKYQSMIDKEFEKEKPNQKRVERLYSKIDKTEHDRKFNKIYKEIEEKYNAHIPKEIHG